MTFEHHEKKRRRRKPGAVAIKQIKYYQQTTDLMISALPFSRVIREIADHLAIDGPTKFRWKSSAVLALQYAAEAYLVAILQDTNKLATHAKRATIRPEDLRMVKQIRGRVNLHEID